jgi:hypothetical protein
MKIGPSSKKEQPGTKGLRGVSRTTLLVWHLCIEKKRQGSTKVGPGSGSIFPHRRARVTQCGKRMLWVGHGHVLVARRGGARRRRVEAVPWSRATVLGEPARHRVCNRLRGRLLGGGGGGGGGGSGGLLGCDCLRGCLEAHCGVFAVSDLSMKIWEELLI